MERQEQRRGRGRPPKPPEQVRRVIGVSLLPATWEALRELSERNGTTRGAVLERLILRAWRRSRKPGEVSRNDTLEIETPDVDGERKDDHAADEDLGQG